VRTHPERVEGSHPKIWVSITGIPRELERIGKKRLTKLLYNQSRGIHYRSFTSRQVNKIPNWLILD
ncbi:MAG: hypothetical protein AB1649_26115, partial [Chloroflexota bacterium]